MKNQNILEKWRTKLKDENKYSINEFIYWIEKYNYGYEEMNKKQYTHSQIASIIARAMIDFFDEVEVPF